MTELLQFFQTYEHFLYFVLGLGVLFNLVQAVSAWQEVRTAMFGLEEHTARRRLNRASVAIFILLINGFVVFILATFIAPAFAPDIPEPLPLQPVNITATYIADPEAAATLQFLNNLNATATPFPTVDANSNGCVAGEIEISSPKDGDTLSGLITVKGTVFVSNFGNYRFDYASTQTGLWRTVQAGNEKVQDGILVENWDLSIIPSGEYILQLVVRDNEGVEMPPCRIKVLISGE